MKDFLHATVPSDPKYLGIIRDMTVRMVTLSGIDECSLNHIKLAVDEACANVIRHAYKGDKNRTIVVKFKITEKHFTITIEDNGVKADPEKIKGRSLSDVRPGGLGIHLINRAFDSVKFDPKKKKGNRLILIKHLQGAQHEH